jgi:hypothetical protein
MNPFHGSLSFCGFVQLTFYAVGQQVFSYAESMANDIAATTRRREVS